MEIRFHRNIKSVIIIIKFDAVILFIFFSCFFSLNESFILSEFEIAVNVVFFFFSVSSFSTQGKAQPR